MLINDDFYRGSFLRGWTKDSNFRCFIVLLLLISGNTTGNAYIRETSSDLTHSVGLSIIHVNVCSLLPKMDSIKILVDMARADIISDFGDLFE